MRRAGLLVFVIVIAACTTNPPPPKQFDVFFQVGSARLTPEGQQVVAMIATSAREMKPSAILVEGEADGTLLRDAQLADQRASAVASALKAAGIDGSKISQHAALVVPANTDPATHISTHKVTVRLMP